MDTVHPVPGHISLEMGALGCSQRALIWVQSPKAGHAGACGCGRVRPGVLGPAQLRSLANARHCGGPKFVDHGPVV